MSGKVVNPEGRFWSKVQRGQSCWLWTASTVHGGYGRFSIGYRRFQAHRLAWQWLRGPIPAGMQLDHLCRTPACVNPDHLEIVTNRENVLRGVGHTARNARKTHCPQGHPYDASHTAIYDGKRHCRACNITRKKAARLREPQP